MTWEMFYLICFAVGLVLTVLSLSGGLHHHMHFGLHRVAHTSHAHSAGGRGISPVNGFTLTAFLCWFGGAGYLLERYGALRDATRSGLGDAKRAGRWDADLLVSGQGAVAA